MKVPIFQGPCLISYEQSKKPHKILFENICSIRQYKHIYDFIPYFGKQEIMTNSGILKTTEIVSIVFLDV